MREFPLSSSDYQDQDVKTPYHAGTVIVYQKLAETVLSSFWRRVRHSCSVESQQRLDNRAFK